MNVEQFKEKYEAFQKEGNEIYSQIKPLLKRLRSLAKRGVKLADKANSDHGLYEKMQVKVGETGGFDGFEDRYVLNFDTSVLLGLWEFEFLVNDPNNAAVEIDNVLYNLKHTKFKTVGKRKQ